MSQNRNKQPSFMTTEEDGDNFYVNIVMNHDNKNGAEPSRAVFSQNFTNIIVDNPSEWFLSVIRFSIPGQLIPIFIFPIQPFPNTNPNLSPFSVTMSYNGNFSSQIFVLYRPIGQLPPYSTYNGVPFPVPPAPSASNPNQTITDYYFVYAYQYMLDMVNKTIATAFSSIPGGTPAGSLPPYFIYDSVEQRISLVAQSAFYDENLSGNGPISLYFNTALQNGYFDAIPVHFLGYDNTPIHPASDGRNFLFQIKDNGNNYYYPPGGQNVFPNPPNNAGLNNTVGAQLSLSTTATGVTTTILPPVQWFIMKQEYNVLTYWSSFKNIVFTSGTIPIQYEQAPINQTQSNIGTSNFFPILTDFNPLLQYGGDQRSVLQYYPQGPYRLIDLNSHVALRKIDIQLFWQDQNNNLYPVFIPNQASINIKLLFVKKSIYQNIK